MCCLPEPSCNANMLSVIHDGVRRIAFRVSGIRNGRSALARCEFTLPRMEPPSDCIAPPQSLDVEPLNSSSKTADALSSGRPNLHSPVFDTCSF